MHVQVGQIEIFVGQGGAEWQADQPTLVLLHGAGMDRTVWVLLARYFARHGYNVVTPDLPEHGGSSGSALLSIDESAEFVGELLDVLKTHHGLPDTPMIIGGHSMGALIAIATSAMMPSKVRHLLLFGAGYPMIVGQPLLDAAKSNQQAAVDMIALYAHSYHSQLGHNAVAGISVQNTAMALLERAKADVLFKDLNACNNYRNLESATEQLTDTPVTLIVGDSDRMTPRKASLNLVTLAKGDLEVLRECGHMVMSEQPEQTLMAMRKVLGNYT